MPKITYGMELLSVFLEIDYMLDNLDKWTSPQVVSIFEILAHKIQR